MTDVEELRETIAAYNDAWNAHDVELIGSMHAPDMVFENHTAGERAEGQQALTHIARIFESWPDIEFETRRLYVREDLVVQEWTARATHLKPLSRGEIVAEPSGRRIEWEGMDVIPFEAGKVKRKDVYSDSVSILRLKRLYAPRPDATQRVGVRLLAHASKNCEAETVEMLGAGPPYTRRCTADKDGAALPIVRHSSAIKNSRNGHGFLLPIAIDGSFCSTSPATFCSVGRRVQALL
ncbi:MAG TPA: nuclear transport factor 2 family protein [Solirubrobacteraceae bacterium]|jgi:steroid delta-isomerase-like uncharacterized protein|nr:nuclear transport factor 2 family protein [Solirubrobacteraceae bacterium]